MSLAFAGNRRYRGHHIRNLVTIPTWPPLLLYSVGYYRNESVISLIAVNLENFYFDFLKRGFH